MSPATMEMLGAAADITVVVLAKVISGDDGGDGTSHNAADGDDARDGGDW